MHLNHSKCSFGVLSRKFLGDLVTHRGIEANPNQIRAITNMSLPKSKREVQKLTGRIAAHNRFILRSTDKCLPFFKLLKGNKKFEWYNECRKAFDELKRHLSTPPTLAKPLTGEKLYLYLAVTEASVSAVLV